ncbi:MAG: ABC transporter ATP-binding protein [Oscillospiraceae bacterium]|jgi:sulfate transport system ATP-binding protein|nr:ABC transporter ATP-binding protein [Oscillospiraceae bacterium]
MYVELKNIHKQFAKFQALEDVSFTIEKGRLVGLLGPSGSGKTTILRVLAGLEQPDAGDIFIDGRRVNDIPASRRGIGFVFQSYALFRYMTVFDNIAFGLEVERRGKAFIRARVEELIALIGLEGMERRYPHQLSGGQKQRVAFARALAPNPQLLLLDEPFAAIDAKVRKDLRVWLREAITKLGITSIFVTHDQDEAIEVADEIIITNHGKIEQKGSPAEIYKNPLTPFAAQFIGQSLALDAYTSLRGFEKYEGYERAVIRPELIHLTKRGGQLYPNAAEEGVVEDVFFRGSLLEVHVRVKGQRMIAYRSLEEDEVRAGERVDVLIYRLYLYNQSRVKLVENALLEDKNPVFI